MLILQIESDLHNVRENNPQQTRNIYSTYSSSTILLQMNLQLIGSHQWNSNEITQTESGASLKNTQNENRYNNTWKTNQNWNITDYC